jgi:hypothetical protein
MITPSGVVSLFQVKKDGNNGGLRSKSSTNIDLQVHQDICRAAALAETKLRRGEEVMVFQEPHQTNVNHTFKEFADTTCESNRAKVLRGSTQRPRFANREDNGIEPVLRD